MTEIYSLGPTSGSAVVLRYLWRDIPSLPEATAPQALFILFYILMTKFNLQIRLPNRLIITNNKLELV